MGSPEAARAFMLEGGQVALLDLCAGLQNPELREFNN